MSDRIVVMRHGAIEQIGTPAMVYDEPETLWVADFVGSSSQLHGKLTVQGADSIVHTDVGALSAGHLSAELTSGDRCVAIVRPESVMLSGVGVQSEHPNQLRATVEEILNMGPQAKVVARTVGGLELVARGPRATMSTDVVPGAEVIMSFPAEAVRVYRADPEVGAAAAGLDDSGPPEAAS